MPKRRQSDEPNEGRRMEVLLEQLRADFRVVAEGHGLLAKEILDMKQTFGQRFDFLETAMVNGFEKVWEAIHEHSHQIGEMSTRLDRNDNRLDENTKRLNENTQRLGEMNNRLENLTARFDVHERAHTA